jgi:hypothetical protein
MNAQVNNIIEADYKKNHAHRAYSLEHVKNVFSNHVKNAGKYMEFKRTLILYEIKKDNVLEFHCLNAGNAKDLISSVNKFLRIFSKEFLVAATYYDNPKLNNFVTDIEFPTFVKKIDDGEDRTYAMIFDLRS